MVSINFNYYYSHMNMSFLLHLDPHVVDLYGLLKEETLQ